MKYVIIPIPQAIINVRARYRVIPMCGLSFWPYWIVISLVIGWRTNMYRDSLPTASKVLIMIVGIIEIIWVAMIATINGINNQV